MSRKKSGLGLGKDEESNLHIVEFSKGKPNEISFNVLGNRAADTGEKKGFFSRLLGGKQDLPHPSARVIGSDVSAPNVNGLETSVNSQPNKTKSTSGKQGSKPGVRVPDGRAQVVAPKHGNKAEKKSRWAFGSKKEAAPPTPLMGSNLQQEVLRRQGARRRNRILSVLVVIVLCVAGAGAGGYYLYNQYLEQLQGIDLLKASVGNIEGADTTIVSIDNYFAKAFDDDTITSAKQLKDDIPVADLRLDAAADMASRASEGLDVGSDDRQAADHAVSSIAARKKLLEVAKERLEEDIAAKTSYDKMESAWNDVEEGNSLMVQAANLVADTTNDNVNQATEYMKEARDCFKKAKATLKDGFASYDQVKEDKEYDYLDLRIKSIKYALASNEAILIQDKKTAEKNNDKYNKLDSKAAKLAKNFSKGFSQTVITAYTSDQESLQKEYENIRTEIGTHDSYIRDYLGDDSWV